MVKSKMSYDELKNYLLQTPYYKKGDIIKHKKTNVSYVVDGFVFDTNTQELAVIYSPLSFKDSKENEEYKVIKFSRPYSETIDGRFEIMKEGK